LLVRFEVILEVAFPIGANGGVEQKFIIFFFFKTAEDAKINGEHEGKSIIPFKYPSFSKLKSSVVISYFKKNTVFKSLLINKILKIVNCFDVFYFD